MRETRPPLAILSTSRKPVREVEAIVRFALYGAEAGDVVVRVKNSAKPGYHGRAYGGIPQRSRVDEIPGAEYLIVLRLGPDDSFPNGNVHDRWRWTAWVAPDAPRPKAWTPEWFGQVKRNRLKRITAVRWGRVVRGPYGGRGAPSFTVADWREALVAVAAHEIRHIEQFRYDWPHSEVDAEKAAYAALLRWRERATTG
jgi:hypothetical protein